MVCGVKRYCYHDQEKIILVFPRYLYPQVFNIPAISQVKKYEMNRLKNSNNFNRFQIDVNPEKQRRVGFRVHDGLILIFIYCICLIIKNLTGILTLRQKAEKIFELSRKYSAFSIISMMPVTCL